MAEFQKVVPVLKVSDMQRPVDFYTGILGFSVAWRAANDGGGENCMVQAGAVDLLLSTGPHLGDRPQFTGSTSTTSALRSIGNTTLRRTPRRTSRCPGPGWCCTCPSITGTLVPVRPSSSG